MKHEESCSKAVLLTLIAGRKQKEALLTTLSAAGARLTNVMYGRGTVKASYIRNVLGLVPEENKVVITSLISKEKADVIFRKLVDKYDFDKPNTGIAFVTPVEKLSY